MSKSSRNIDDLREHLFATLAALRDTSNPMDIDRARAVSEVAKTIIDSAKVEVEYMRMNGGGESEFIGAIGSNNLPEGITGVMRHRIRG